jgi:hypothetical protein
VLDEFPLGIHMNEVMMMMMMMMMMVQDGEKVNIT